MYSFQIKFVPFHLFCISSLLWGICLFVGCCNSGENFKKSLKILDYSFVFAVAGKLLRKESATVKEIIVQFSLSEPPGFLRHDRDSTDENDPSDNESGRSSLDDDNVNSSNLSVLVLDVPEDMEGFLEIALENQSCGSVMEYEPNKKLGGVLVTFDVPEGLYHWANFISSLCCFR
jgi:hypothetical protein